MKIEILPLSSIKAPESWGAVSKTGKSIRALGFVSALTVRDVDGKYEIIDGRRRYADLVEMGATDAPCVIVEASDVQASAMALALNTARSDSPMDEAEQITILGEAGFGDDYVSRMIGVSKATIAKRLRMTALPDELKRGFREGKIAVTTITSLANMSAEDQKKAVDLFTKYGEIKSTDVSAIKSDLLERSKVEWTPEAVFTKAVKDAYDDGLTEKQMIAIVRMKITPP